MSKKNKHVNSEREINIKRTQAIIQTLYKVKVQKIVHFLQSEVHEYIFTSIEESRMHNVTNKCDKKYYSRPEQIEENKLVIWKRVEISLVIIVQGEEAYKHNCQFVHPLVGCDRCQGFLSSNQSWSPHKGLQ